MSNDAPHDDQPHDAGPWSDAWLDASLSELIGNHTPPDLTQRILQRAGSSGEPADALAGPPGRTEADLRAGSPVPLSDHRLSHPPRVWIAVWTSAAVLLITAGAALWFTGGHLGRWYWARLGPAPGTSGPAARDAGGLADGHDSQRDASSPEDRADSSLVSENAPRWDGSGPLERPPAEPPAPTDPTRADLEALTATQLVARIDRHFQQVWQAHNVSSMAAPDTVWLDRVWTALFGTLPGEAERADLLTGRPRLTRDEILVRLLEREPWRDQWRERWASVFSRALLDGGLSADDPAAAQLQAYWVGALRDGQGLDMIVRSLLTAQGSNQPEAEDHDPAVAFWSSSELGTTTEVTDRICRSMLGQRLDCARCHGHPLGSWSQESYWQIDAFLSQLKRTRSPGSTFIGLSDRGPTAPGVGERSAGVFFERPDGTIVFAAPAIQLDSPARSRWQPSAPASDDELRRQLAEQLTSSDHFARALANRIWSTAFGAGLVTPVDDLGPHNPSPHAGLLSLLADQLAAHEYDLAQALQWILLSEPLRAEAASQPVMGDEIVLFDHFPRPPLQLPSTPATLELLADLTGGRTSLADLERRGIPWLGQSGSSPAGGSDRRRPVADVGLSQVLEWLGTQALRPTLDEADQALIRRLGDADLTVDEQIDHAFQTLLRRRPSRAERAAAQQLLSAGSVETGLQQIWTALRSVAEAAAFR